MKSDQNCQEPEHCWWISRTVLRWYIEQKSAIVRDSGYPFLPFSVLGSKGISCSCDILQQSCFTWFPLALVEGFGVLPASSSYARAGWGMLALEGSGAACWKHMLAHLLASAVSVLLQRLEYKCVQRKRHLKIDICSVAPLFQPQLILWILFSQWEKSR